MSPEGRTVVVRKARGILHRRARDRRIADAYHRLLTLPWPMLTAVIALFYTLANALFALAYLADGDSIVNARQGSFADAFFFSVQTLATIGYGNMSPKGTYANALVMIEAFLGVISFAVITGLMFSKFAQPTARVLFSRSATVSRRDGVPSLTFRMANERHNRIVEARLRVVLARDDTTAEGESIRRLEDLRLTRSETPIFTLTWAAVHPIDESSPLRGHTAESLSEVDAEIIALLTGLDETLAQTIHARHAYHPEDILWGRRFADILQKLPDGRTLIDYRDFHETVAVADDQA
ncbi:MAG: inward rectifier potassium channel [Candidatus Binatota bacterium]|nr:inward rectifier potassium channel [Candidatus Binatota bacterium]